MTIHMSSSAVGLDLFEPMLHKNPPPSKNSSASFQRSLNVKFALIDHIYCVIPNITWFHIT